VLQHEKNELAFQAAHQAQAPHIYMERAGLPHLAQSNLASAKFPIPTMNSMNPAPLHHSAVIRTMNSIFASNMHSSVPVPGMGMGSGSEIYQQPSMRSVAGHESGAGRRVDEVGGSAVGRDGAEARGVGVGVGIGGHGMRCEDLGEGGGREEEKTRTHTHAHAHTHGLLEAFSDKALWEGGGGTEQGAKASALPGAQIKTEAHGVGAMGVGGVQVAEEEAVGGGSGFRDGPKARTRGRAHTQGMGVVSFRGAADGQGHLTAHTQGLTQGHSQGHTQPMLPAVAQRAVAVDGGGAGSGETWGASRAMMGSMLPGIGVRG
jgi:hypothetical protein